MYLEQLFSTGALESCGPSFPQKGVHTVNLCQAKGQAPSLLLGILRDQLRIQQAKKLS